MGMVGQLDPPIVRMPDFAPGDWLNVQQPLTKALLRGQVVLIDFWDYACVNCLRTLPYLTRWHERYAGLGLTIIGIHTPEFAFGQIRQQVETAVAHYNLRYPILLDNRYQNWERFTAKAWPTKFLVDAAGYMRLRRQGEGYYQQIESALQILLRQHNPDAILPDPLPPLREEDTPGAVCYRPTPELYAGYQGGGLFGGALGNPAGYFPNNPVFYDLPAPDERQVGQFFVEGVWRAWPEALAYAGEAGGKIVLPYQAAAVNAVLSPTADPVALRLGLRPSARDPRILVQQNGRFLDSTHAGTDIQFTPDGVSYIMVDRPRMFQLVRNPDFGWHELTLTFQAGGLALFAFSFSSCLAPHARPDEPNTYQVR